MLLGKPLTLGPVTLRNRMVGAPMERNYCDLDGHVMDLYIDYIANRAEGGAALVFTEATYVRQDGKSRLRQMGLTHDGHIEGIRRMADRVHAAGSLLGIELNHGGRTAQGRVSGLHAVAPSPIPLQAPGSDVPIELSVEDIREIVDSFGAAAARCRAAEVDVISLHAAHGYLIQSFMSPATNHRNDQYGDPTLFLREVIEAVRAEAGGMAVGMRLSAFEGNEGGLTAAEQLSIFERAGGGTLDFVDVSAGNYEAPEWSVQPAEFERGLLAPFAAAYKKFGIPVGVAGRICDPETAGRILEAEQADFISTARTLHADAQFPLRVLNNQPYRPCIACNLCADELGSGEPIRCSVNVWVDKPGQELQAPPAASHTARILVVGAGPSGLETACLLAESGHQVTLVDENESIGGQFRLPARLKGVPEYKRVLKWYEYRLRNAGVQLSLKTRVTPDVVASQAPDAVVLATGSYGRPGAYDGAASTDFHDIRAWLATTPETPSTAIIIGGDREAVAVGYDLANKGTLVTIIAEEDEIGLDVGRRAKILTLPYLQTSDKVRLLTRSRVSRFEDGEIVVEEPAGTVRVKIDGPVLTTLGAVRNTRLRDELTPGMPALFDVLHDDEPSETIIDALLAARDTAQTVWTALEAGQSAGPAALPATGATVG